MVPRFLKAVEQAQVSPSASTRPLPTATADLARAERTGWAEKKGVMKWNKRWLVLTPFMLSTYKSDEPGIAPTKILDLHSALVSKVVRRLRAPVCAGGTVERVRANMNLMPSVWDGAGVVLSK